jgi:4-aminobutyrate aminotransferase-like enzyme
MVNPEFKKFDFKVKGADQCYIFTDKAKLLDFSGSGMTTGYNFFPSNDIPWISSLSFDNYFTNNLTDELSKLSSFSKVAYTTSGTEACDTALFRYKFPIISLEGAYHGRTYLTYFTSNGTGIDEEHKVIHLKFPGRDFNETVSLNDSMLEEASKKYDLWGSPLIIELIQSDGGVRPIGKNFLDYLLKIREKYGLRMIVDEVYTGFGRSGEIFLFKKMGLNPDMVCLGKGMAGGLPLGAVLYNGEWDLPYGNVLCMQGGNAASSAASLKVLQSLNSQRLDFVRKEGKKIIDEIRQIENRKIRDVRGIGFMIGIDVGNDGPEGREYAYKIREYLETVGVIVTLVGANNDVIKVTPPVMIEEKDLRLGVDKIITALSTL